MKMSLYVSVFCGAVFYSFSLQAACVTPPDCANLGYTSDASKCAGAALKCPWDLTKAACKEKGQEAPLPILYGDGTVTKEILSNKTPIGIVFDEANKLAVALTDVKKDGTSGSEGMYWADRECDVVNLENCSTDNPNSDYASSPIDDNCGVNGRLNTTAMLSNTCGGRAYTAYTAIACNKYEPVGCIKNFCKKENWFLPSLKELSSIGNNKNSIDNVLILLDKPSTDALGEKPYWSSTEESYRDAWEFYMVDLTSGFDTKDINKYFVRPVVKY